MDNIKLKEEIHRLRPWYQNVKFNSDISAVSSHSELSGEYAWNYIKKLLPDLNEKRVLDLGSNAGLFCIRCSQAGAKEVIGIEKENKHLRQCKFLKKYFDTKNVEFINTNLENLPKMDIGKFDLILAIAVLYWVGRPVKKTKGSHYDLQYRDKEKKFIDHIVTLTDTLIVRARGSRYNNSEYYGDIFMKHGFNMIQLINEDIGNHEMMLFKKEIK